MVIPDESVGYQFVNFIITLAVLNILLLKPIRGVIQKRKELMAEQQGKIEKFTESAEAKVKDYEAALLEARKEGNTIRADFKDAGSAEEQKLMGAAGQEAAATLKEAHAQIDSDVKSAMGELQKSVGEYAKKATDKILGLA